MTEMTHAECQVELVALEYGELAPAQARAVEGHLAGCESCRAERESLASTRRMMRALPPEAPPDAWTRSVMAVAREAASAARETKRPWWMTMWFSPAMALATGLVVVGGASWWSLQKSGNDAMSPPPAELTAVAAPPAPMDESAKRDDDAFAKLLAPAEAPAAGPQNEPEPAPMQKAEPKLGRGKGVGHAPAPSGIGGLGTRGLGVGGGGEVSSGMGSALDVQPEYKVQLEYEKDAAPPASAGKKAAVREVVGDAAKEAPVVVLAAPPPLSVAAVPAPAPPPGIAVDAPPEPDRGPSIRAVEELPAAEREARALRSATSAQRAPAAPEAVVASEEGSSRGFFGNLFGSDDADEAEAAAPKAAAAPAPPRFESVFEQALAAKGRNDCRAAAELFREARAAQPQHPRAAASMLAEADCATRLGEDAQARALYLEVLRRWPKSPEAQSARAALGPGPGDPAPAAAPVAPAKSEP